jgi:hypothetical protein
MRGNFDVLTQPTGTCAKNPAVLTKPKAKQAIILIIRLLLSHSIAFYFHSLIINTNIFLEFLPVSVEMVRAVSPGSGVMSSSRNIYGK